MAVLFAVNVGFVIEVICIGLGTVVTELMVSDRRHVKKPTELLTAVAMVRPKNVILNCSSGCMFVVVHDTLTSCPV